MNTGQLSRRSVLAGLLSTVTMLRTSRGASSVTPEAAVIHMSVRLGVGLTTIGHHYMQKYHPAAHVETLARHLVQRLNAASGNLQLRLSMAVQEDFAQGRVVRVGGWLLSVTEAQVFAVAYLAQTRLRPARPPSS